MGMAAYRMLMQAVGVGDLSAADIKMFRDKHAEQARRGGEVSAGRRERKDGHWRTTAERKATYKLISERVSDVLAGRAARKKDGHVITAEERKATGKLISDVLAGRAKRADGHVITEEERQAHHKLISEGKGGANLYGSGGAFEDYSGFVHFAGDVYLHRQGRVNPVYARFASAAGASHYTFLLRLSRYLLRVIHTYMTD